MPGLPLPSHRRVYLGRPVVVRAEPHVERKVVFPVIALEVAVMQLMEIRGSRNAGVSLDDERLEPDVTLCRGERGVLRIHQHVDRVRGHDPVNQNATEVKNMLNRVHGQAGPRPDVDVLVMEIVPGLVERRPMQQTMRPVEVEQPPHLDAAEQDDEVDRLLSWVDIGDGLVGVRPYHQDFVSRPGRAAADAAPEDVVAKLIAPEELALSGRHPDRGIFVLEPLGLERPESEVPPADDDHEHCHVAHIDLKYPVGSELDASGQRRLKVEPRQRRDRHVDDVPRKHVTREAEQPFEDLDRLRRPGE